MDDISRLIGVVAAVAWVAGAAAGCVDQEASLKLRGVVAPPGTAQPQEVNCAGDGEAEQPVPQPNYTCQGQIEPGEADNFFSQMSLNIDQFERKKVDGWWVGGQLGGDNGTVITEGEFCNIGPETYRSSKYRHSSFLLSFDAINQLEDSREVGSQGQGGGGGGFSGLKLDRNDIQTRSFKLRFPDVPETGGDNLGIDRDIDFSMVVDSGEGGIAVSLELFSQGDIENLRTLHETVALRRANLGSYNDQAKGTTVTMTAEMWIEGETLGGRDVESNKMTFPVKVCGNGCGMTPRCAFQQGG